jgi:HlyD family secretion protein
MQTTLPFPQTHGHVGAQRPKRRWLRWLLIPLILALLAGGGLWWRSSQQATAVTTTTATVSQGDLAVTVSGSGTVAAARTVDVPLQQTGTVTSVAVTVGDQVKAGQTLAAIDAGALKLALAQAQANLTAAKASYAKVKDGSATPQDLASAQAQLASAKAQLQQTTTGTATAADIASAKAQLAAAQAKLNALKNPSQADRNAAQTKVDQAQLALQGTRDSSSQTKTNAQLALESSTNALTQAQSKYALAQSNWQHVQDEGTDPTNPTTTDSNGNKKANKLNEAERQQYYDAFVQAQAALDSAQNAVTQAQVAYDTARQNEVTNVQQAETTLKAAQDDLAALLNPSTSDLTQAQATVTQAQATLTNLQQGGTAAEVTQAQAAVTQAQASLDALTAPASDSDLASAEAALTQAQVAVDTAQANLAQATLTAPFDGVVSAVNVVTGSTNTSTVTLVDVSKLHIDVSLSETDAAKVAVGQPVTLTFDALPDATLTGTVTSVAPVATTEQNVVTYDVQVAFDPGATAVKVGMSATADIQVDQATGALLVPSRAIQTSGDTKTVTVQQGDTTLTVPVETGLTSGGKTAIVSSGGAGVAALKAGDVLVVPSTTSSTNTSSAAKASGGLSSLTGSAGGPSSGGPAGP